MKIICCGVLLAAQVAVAQSRTPSGQTRQDFVRADSAGLVALVRARPVDAREAIADLREAAVHSPATAAAALASAQRLAAVYANVWSDSFPAQQLARFRRMNAPARAAQVAADSVRLAGNRALGERGVDAAVRFWHEAVRRSRALRDTAGMAMALGNMGYAMHLDARPDSAKRYLARAITLARAVGDRRTVLNAERTLGAVAMARGDLAAARVAFSAALQAAGQIGDLRGTASDHTNLGLVAAELGELTEARSRYRQAIAIARAQDSQSAEAAALLNLANADTEAGDYDAAALAYAEALRAFRAIGDSSGAALALQDFGLLDVRRGAYGSALARLETALDLFNAVGTAAERARIRRDIALALAAVGDLETATMHLRDAERLLPADEEHVAVHADLALAAADVAAQLNQLAEADRKYALARTLYRRAADPGGEMEAAQGRAELLIARRVFDRAIEQLVAIRRTQLAARDRRAAALTQLTLGRAHRERGDLIQARRVLRNAADTLRHLEDGVGEAAALSLLGDVELDVGAPVAAEALYRAGLALLTSRDVPTVAWQLHAGLGRALRQQGVGGRTADAADQFRRAIAHIERTANTLPATGRRSAFLADKWGVYADLALAQRELGDVSAAFQTTERMRARQQIEQLDRARIRGAPADSAWLTERHDLRVRISELTRRVEIEQRSAGRLRGRALEQAPAEVREALATAEAEYARLIGGRARPEPATMPAPPVSWTSVRLPRGQAMVVYLVTDSTTLAFVVTSDTLRALDLNIARAPLARLIDFARGTMTRQADSLAWRAPLRRLHQQLIEPLELAHLLDGIRELVIVPHAELHYLPFAALLSTGPPPRFLVDRFDISYAPSATAFVQLRSREPASGVSVMAVAPHTRRLPGTRDEVAAIRELFGDSALVLMDADATEHALLERLASFRVVHLATYGVLNQHNPLFSHVELARSADTRSDGRLEVHEVLGMSLRARLVVLSACQTALASGALSDVPPGDDWVGLVRAFLVAGADKVIATLWAVDDRSTATLMERLYMRLRRNEAEAAALAGAQRELLRNPGTASPFYWAGFTLVGAP